MGVLVVSLAAVGALGFFSHGLGGIQKQGYRRAAAERARERLEQLMQANVVDIAGEDPADGQQYWLTCSAASGVLCTSWTRRLTRTTDTISLNGVFNGQREIAVQRVHDRTTGTSQTTLDAVELSVKVWFTANIGTDDDFNRVQLKTLRAPSP